jgi:hypothetical protein
VLLAVGGLGLAARPDVRIDNTSIESFRSTWERLYRGLSRAERRTIENAVVRIALAPYHSPTEVPQSLNRGIGPEVIRGQIGGMTYDEIIQLSEKSSVTVERTPR